MTMRMPLDSNGYGQHAGRRQLGLDAPKPQYAPQACGGAVTIDCYRICLRKCYPPGHAPPAPDYAGAPCATDDCAGKPFIYAFGGRRWCADCYQARRQAA